MFVSRAECSKMIRSSVFDSLNFTKVRSRALFAFLICLLILGATQTRVCCTLVLGSYYNTGLFYGVFS